MDAAIHFPIFVNAVGHLAGIIAFAAFLALLGRGAILGGRAGLSAPAAPAAAAAAAALALLWNLGSLVVLFSGPGSSSREIVASLSFAVLSMLPCVLLHLALGTDYPWLRAAGYVTGPVAAALHLLEASGIAFGFHELAIDLSTYGFGGLAVVFVLLLARGRSDRRPAMRALAATSLFLLAASFVHFEVDPGPASWVQELVFHHAAIPLALFILLQDYRFLLLDAFVRLLGVVLLAGAFSGALLGALLRLGWLRVEVAGALGLAAFALAMTAAILLYPRVRDRIGEQVEPVLFRRGDIEATLQRMRSLDSGQSPFIEQAARLIADYVSAQRWSLSEAEEACPDFGVEALDARTIHRRPGCPAWAEVAVALRVSPERSRIVWLGPRKGGRRFLGADLGDLERLAAEAAAKLESLRRDEQQRLLAQAELQALRAQINPHFLFNALNALYGIIPRAAPGARQTLLHLADILRYSLDNKRQYVALEEEIRVVEAYLAIERLRLQERLSVRIDCDESARAAKIPAFTIQPLVENAVKHGISGNPQGGNITVGVRLANERLSIEVSDDGVGFDADAPAESGHALHNVQRRLHLCYGEAAEFRIESSKARTRIRFSAPVTAERAPGGVMDVA